MSNSNGHLNKTVTRRKTYTYKSPLSELSITYRIVPLRASIDFGMSWRAKHKPPSALVETEVAGEKRMIENLSDPDYQRAMADYEREARAATDTYVWRNAIVLTGEQREEVAEYRKDFEQEDVTLREMSDEEIYATHIVCLTFEEELELSNSIYRVAQPTKEVVNQVKTRFQDSV